jgi:hypothetical protein
VEIVGDTEEWVAEATQANAPVMLPMTPALSTGVFGLPRSGQCCHRNWRTKVGGTSRGSSSRSAQHAKRPR